MLAKQIYPLSATVLIVDDCPINRAIAKSLFKRAGIEEGNILFADNGLLAVNQVKARQMTSDSLIIYMDHDMPVMTGSEAIRLIREAEERLGLRKSFIFTCSASCHEPIPGSDVRVPKVLNLNVVCRLIQQAVEGL